MEIIVNSQKPEPLRPFADKITLSPERFDSVPKYYIETTADHAVTPLFQKAMIAANGQIVAVHRMPTSVHEADIPATMAWTTLESAQHWLVVTVPRDCRTQAGCTAEALCRRIGEHVFEKSKFGAVIPKILVMNDDIDPTNIGEVVWAFATCCPLYRRNPL